MRLPSGDRVATDMRDNLWFLMRPPFGFCSRSRGCYGGVVALKKRCAWVWATHELAFGEEPPFA
eukprot:10961073-Lingulodinium_polyedra.AAC.1